MKAKEMVEPEHCISTNLSSVLADGARRLPGGSAVGGPARPRLAVPRHDLRYAGGTATLHASQRRLTLRPIPNDPDVTRPL